MSRNDLEEVVAHTRFGFFRLESGEKLSDEGSPYNRLLMMTNGRLHSIRHSDDRDYSVEEIIEAPCMIEPVRLFGMNQCHRSALVALETSNFVSLSKEEIHKLCTSQALFRVNYINMLSLMAQKAEDASWHSPASTYREHLAAFFRAHCATPTGQKTFRILMNRLALEINVSRREVSAELNKMKEDGLVRLGRGRIEIPRLEALP